MEGGFHQKDHKEATGWSCWLSYVANKLLGMVLVFFAANVIDEFLRTPCCGNLYHQDYRVGVTILYAIYDYKNLTCGRRFD